MHFCGCDDAKRRSVLRLRRPVHRHSRPGAWAVDRDALGKVVDLEHDEQVLLAQMLGDAAQDWR
jgi:hypothetical protein